MAKQLFACLLLVLAFCVARSLQENVACMSSGTNVCQCTGGGITLDISNYLSYPYKGIPDKKFPEKYTYTFAPCAGIPSSQCNNGPSATVKVCQVYLEQAHAGDHTNVATEVNSTWYITNTSANSLRFEVHFTNGESGRSAAVTFQYDNSATVITNQEETGTTYNFLVKGSNVKAVGGGGGSKKKGGAAAGVVGLVLISVFIVGVATYFIVGGLVNYYHRGARGAEVIPNYAFWKDLPFLIKDGFFFMISPCYKGGEEKGYQSL